MLCSACVRRVYYVSKTVAPMVLHPFWRRTDAWEPGIALEAGAFVCTKCVARNSIEMQVNPVPVVTQAKRRLSKARPSQLVIGDTIDDAEAYRLRRVAVELDGIADALLGRHVMGGSADRLRCIASELSFIAGAVERCGAKTG
jgi:hypothetical protein